MDPSTIPLTSGNHALSDRAVALMAISWLFTSFAIVTMTFRLYLRQKFFPSIASDDWLMLLALAFHVVFQVFLTMCCVAGLGRPLETMGIQDLIDMTKWAWFTTPGSILASTIARISIAMVFYQVFNGRQWFRWLMISYTSFLVVVGMLNFIFVWVQAKPVQALWDFRVPATYRMEQLPQKVVTCILTITYTLSDIIYTVFPIIFISKLNMNRARKLQLCLLMAGSIITTAVAIGRTTLVFLSLFQKTDVSAAMDSDRTFIYFGVGSLLASIEQCLLVVIGSIPKLQVAKKLSFPKIHSSLNTLLNKLRYGSTAASTSASQPKPTWDDSNLEHKSGSKGAYSSHPDFIPIVQNSHISFSKSSHEMQEHGIQVTEGYSVTYNHTPQQPRSPV
ncbi:hypothetical protein KVR01_008001 [Diaporthe batatas]|uniref:uncharacterized protein n=1 Tax=Diaporthe batatas TaxID=748121 RepID=UPI001D0361FA|nr:uncharacterized protein KVR01_008001 [Diaporthe batatas]KAG8162236.1 hypothetical protein KVR01_008001 [Diaporthe batatas]